MPRAKLLGRPTIDLVEEDDEPAPAGTGTAAPKDCLLCTLIDEAHDEVDDAGDDLDDDEIDDLLRDQLATAMAFGALVLSRSDAAVATCADCHEAVAQALADVKRDLRKVRRERPKRERARRG